MVLKCIFDSNKFAIIADDVTIFPRYSPGNKTKTKRLIKRRLRRITVTINRHKVSIGGHCAKCSSVYCKTCETCVAHSWSWTRSLDTLNAPAMQNCAFAKFAQTHGYSLCEISAKVTARANAGKPTRLAQSSAHTALSTWCVRFANIRVC